MITDDSGEIGKGVTFIYKAYLLPKEVEELLLTLHLYCVLVFVHFAHIDLIVTVASKLKERVYQAGRKYIRVTIIKFEIDLILKLDNPKLVALIHFGLVLKFLMEFLH